jgi:uncharacterized protein YcbX
MSELVVTRLGTTPIKGLRMQCPEEVIIGPTGAIGDRDFLLIDEDGAIVSISKAGPLPGLVARFDPASRRLSVVSASERCEGTIQLGESVTIGWWLEMRDVPARRVSRGRRSTPTR